MVEHIIETKLFDEELQEDKDIVDDKMYTFDNKGIPTYK